MAGKAESIVNFGTTTDEIMNWSSIPDEKRLRIGREILNGFEKNGFVYLQNFANFKDWLKEYYACNDEFFALPTEVKSKYPRDFKFFHGWGFHKEEKAADCPTGHETMDISKLSEIPKAEVPKLKPVTEYGVTLLRNVIRFIFSAVEPALGYKKNYFNDKCHYNCYERNLNQIRYIRYPPLDKSYVNTQRFVTHQDFGSFTILIMDDTGGLELKTPRGEWVEARTDIPNSALLIAGEMMSVITKKRIPAVPHRVVSRKNVAQYRRNVDFYSSFDWNIHILPPGEPVTDATETGLEIFRRMSKTVYKCTKDSDYAEQEKVE